ncbi:hypothetical protein V6N11_024530 [Hibiscus sabdariffa]|uniref:Uncharacterized protein n=1 Tax=Hibiscus sabdariffa TaxID=183260 RepID=A0ABR2QMD7_9ROSI
MILIWPRLEANNQTGSGCPLNQAAATFPADAEVDAAVIRRCSEDPPGKPESSITFPSSPLSPSDRSDSPSVAPIASDTKVDAWECCTAGG